MLASSAVDRGLEPDFKICICCFSTKHAALRSKSKDWLARYQDNMYEWSLQYPWTVVSVLSKSNSLCWSSTKQTSPWYSWKSAELVLHNNLFTHSHHHRQEQLQNGQFVGNTKLVILFQWQLKVVAPVVSWLPHFCIVFRYFVTCSHPKYPWNICRLTLSNHQSTINQSQIGSKIVILCVDRHWLRCYISNYHMIKTMKIAFGYVMVISVLSSSTVDHRFRPLPIKPKTRIGICCFSAKHAVLGSKSQDWSKEIMWAISITWCLDRPSFLLSGISYRYLKNLIFWNQWVSFNQTWHKSSFKCIRWHINHPTWLLLL